ncbi:hypothetical protein SAMN05216359_10250 [Roseateles sp. YR242]|uniref:hypothetical protein n=1 Tax=Roseateles sp. YR242 TaxID=1855305 RepID=UPI0008C34842|nr:hypothetical protein [Roseateles sp. YR242]SEK51623.1 hypothetical protein SAMN05216359_10250 [Roseateles sp. YR242]
MTSIRSMPATLPTPMEHDLGRPDPARRAQENRHVQDARRLERARQEQTLPPLSLTRSPTAGLGLEAFEEITFQSSEREEAEVHDELHDHHVREAEKVQRALPVEKVMAVMRLMAGHEGYQILNTRARMFARDFLTDREGALERLKPQSLRPEERILVLGLAEGLLSQSQTSPETAATVQALRSLEAPDPAQVSHLIKIYESASKTGEGTVTGTDSTLLQYLSSPLSARMLMDAIGTPEGLKALSDQVQRLPGEGRFEQAGAFVGLSVSLAHLMAVIRTMDGHVATLAGALQLPPAENGKLLRLLMDMCRTAAPRPKLEKLRSDVLKQIGPAQSLRFDLELMKQVGQYPESVWISIDAKTAVQGWLREAQGLHYRREGVFSVNGKLQRDAITTVAPAA